MAQIKNNPILLDNTTKLFGVRDNVPGEVVPGFLGVHNLLHVQDQKDFGVEGGTFTSGAWRTRALNTVVTNNIAGASLNASNQITLPVGEYFCLGFPTAYRVNWHQSRIRNITSGLTLVIGMIEIATTNYGNSQSNICDKFSINAESLIELQHRCYTTGTTNGFGSTPDAGIFEVLIYSDLKIWKLA